MTAKLTIEPISDENLEHLTNLSLELWNNSIYEEEFNNWAEAKNSSEEICFLAKYNRAYVAFIHVTTRNDYVEGSETSPVAYVEGVYVQRKYRNSGIVTGDLQKPQYPHVDFRGTTRPGSAPSGICESVSRR